MLAFLKEQRICLEESEVSFERLLKQDAPHSADFLEQFRLSTQDVIEEFAYRSFSPGDWAEPIAVAATALFLVMRGDLLLADAACRRAGNSERAVKILYEYSWMSDEEQHKSEADRTPFYGVVRRAIERTNPRMEYFSEFQRALTSGYLFRRISDIPLTRLRHINDQVNKAVSQMDFEAKLKSHLQALDTFLQSQLKTGIIMESLRMQLVGAYVITAPTGADVIRGVVDDFLPETCEQLATDDPTYSQIFIKAETGEASVGRYTRLGVVRSI